MRPPSFVCLRCDLLFVELHVDWGGGGRGTCLFCSLHVSSCVLAVAVGIEPTCKGSSCEGLNYPPACVICGFSCVCVVCCGLRQGDMPSGDDLEVALRNKSLGASPLPGRLHSRPEHLSDVKDDKELLSKIKTLITLRGYGCSPLVLVTVR